MDSPVPRGMSPTGRVLLDVLPVLKHREDVKTTELFDVTAARDHFDGTVEAGECRFCAFDARNREHHAQNAGKLF